MLKKPVAIFITAAGLHQDGFLFLGYASACDVCTNTKAVDCCRASDQLLWASMGNFGYLSEFNFARNQSVAQQATDHCPPGVD
jgi:hypothetical protein